MYTPYHPLALSPWLFSNSSEKFSLVVERRQLRNCNKAQKHLFLYLLLLIFCPSIYMDAVLQSNLHQLSDFIMRTTWTRPVVGDIAWKAI